MENSKTIEDFLRDILPFVTRPNRYLGNELNVNTRKPRSGDIRVVLVFPDIYDIGQSYIGFHILYHILNKRHGVVCERAFAPWPDMEEAMRRRRLPLFSLETKTPLKQFDVVGITLPYELTFTSILNLLDLSGIPLYSSERSEEDPIILGGGCCTVNPEPMADFFDAFSLGDGEEIFCEIVEKLKDTKKRGIGRIEKIKELAAIPGIYVPSLYRPVYNILGDYLETVPVTDDIPRKVRARIVPELKQEYYTQRPLLPSSEIVHDHLAIEVMRGCSRGCRFCVSGMISRPVRFRKDSDIREQIRGAVATTGWEEVSLVSLSTSDHPQIEQLAGVLGRELSERVVSLGVSSLRADSFSIGIARSLKRHWKSGLTFAVEAGSQRLRDVINKNVTEKELFGTLETAFSEGWRGIKLYFMIGLPTETSEDIIAIIKLINKVTNMAKRFKAKGINVTISSFIPKPFTPFQWERFDDLDSLREKIRLIKRKTNYRMVKIKDHLPEMSRIEAIIARGDRKLGRVIHDVFKNGARLEGWNELFDPCLWDNAFAKYGIDTDMELGSRSIYSRLPWSHLSFGPDEAFFRNERERAYWGVKTEDCRTIGCSGCVPERVSCGITVLHREKNESKISGETAPTREYGRKPRKRIQHTSVYVVGTRIRLKYAKQGPARFIGHLDVVRMFDRLLRRAGVPIAYTKGYHPRPKIAFSHPLPLGMESTAEYADFYFDHPFGNLSEALKDWFPPGFIYLESKPVLNTVQSLSSAINLVEYHVFCEVDDYLAMRIDSLLAKDEIVITRIRNNNAVPLDIRPFISELSLNGGTTGPLVMCLRTGGEKAARPQEILEVLLEEGSEEIARLNILRVEQYIESRDIRRTPMGV